jgi:hypothetical protein
MSLDADSCVVRNRAVFVDTFVDAFRSFSFVLSFQRLAAFLRQGSVLLSPIVVGEWSINGPQMQTALLTELFASVQVVQF